MSSCSSDFEDCIEEMNSASQSKRKEKRKSAKEFCKWSGGRQKSCVRSKRENAPRRKKAQSRARLIERSHKAHQTDHGDVRNNTADNVGHSGLNVAAIAADPIDQSHTNPIEEFSGDSDDSDKSERMAYIKLLSKLIDLNMPSKIELNRSNEAYSKRQCFLEKRLYNSDKIDSCCQLFCSDSFWLELQHRVKSLKEDRIMKMKDKTIEILREIYEFKIVESGFNDLDTIKDKNYAISKSYLTKIQLAHNQVSNLLDKYHYCLSFWSTSATMEKFILETDPFYANNCSYIIENIETLQAWENCCNWLNWKTQQICQLVGISGRSLKKFVICGRNTIICVNPSESHIEYNEFEEKKIQYDKNIESRIFSGDKSRTRSQSLNMTIDYDDSSDLILNDSVIETSSDSDYESKFESYADINRRRDGLEKVCYSSIESVRKILTKYKNLFSITKEENILPLMHSYADAVKDGSYSPPIMNNHNGAQLIFTETVSEASESSYKTAKPIIDDNHEFPTIQSSHSINLQWMSSPPLSSNPSMSQILNEDVTQDMDNALPISMDLNDILKRRFEHNLSNQRLDNGLEPKGIFGLKNKVAARLYLPPLLPHYLFLARFPVKIMHCCIRKILSTADMSKISLLSALTIKQRIIDYKDALQYTMKAREFLFEYTFGINFQINKFLASNCKDLAPKQDIDVSDFMSSSMKEIDGDLSSLLRFYIDCLKELLKKWSKSSSSCKFEYGEPRQLLEEEWNFVKTYCHSIKQEEEIVASSFCNLAEYLFDLLKSRMESDHKRCFEVDGSSNDSHSSNPEDDNTSISSINNRHVSKRCQSYNHKCKMIQFQLRQAVDFAKMLRGDLEISIQLELNINYSMNDFLNFLSSTKHKMIDMCSLDNQTTNNQTDLTLIIPEESSQFIKELLDPLITGFSLQSKDDNMRASLLGSSTSKSQCSMAREYILIINKKSKINWPGEKIKFIDQLNIGNLQQRIESSNIVFLARRPDELIDQLSHLLEYKIPLKSTTLQFKNVIQSCSEDQVEACHYNSKRNLISLKSKAIEIGQALHSLFIFEKRDFFDGSELNKIQEETLRNSIKNSYSIIFDFYRDLIKLCTGNAFKSSLKSAIINLLEKWFTFSRRFEPSDKGTVPRWANDGLTFLFQLCQSRVVINMNKREWQDFKKNLDNFVEFIVGKSSRQNSNTSCKSTTNSSRAVTSRSWLMAQKPDIIRGCENNFINTQKIENWNTNCENRTLRSAFSEPSRMIISEQNVVANRNEHHINFKADGKFNEITFTRSITINDPCIDQSREVPNSNKSTDGSSNEDHKDRKRITLNQAIIDLEKQLNEKRRQNNLMGSVLDSNSENTSSCYIKKAPFQWIKKSSIGQGRSGTVYKVCNLETMEIMAMKEIVINEPFSQDLIECDLLCKLNNPSLLKYYGVDISLSHLRIFTEYCESGSLSHVSILDIPEVILRQWTIQVLDAIMHLHNHKIVHRDVKPDNIFLKNIEDTHECHAKLGDFGVAKCLSNHQDGLRDIKGTVMYMAPEVVLVDSEQNKSKQGYNHKVDIWSLGCTVLYMITGKHPWDETNQLTIYYNLGNKRQPHVPKIDSTPRMTKEARDFIIDCLQITPHERPEAIDLLNYNFVNLRKS